MARHDGAAFHVSFDRAFEGTREGRLHIGTCRRLRLELAALAREAVLQASDGMARCASGDDGVGVLRVDDLPLPCVAHRAFLDGEEARPALHALGAERQGGEQSSSVGDAACRDNGNGHGACDRGDERHGGELADVAAGLRPLCDDGVGPQALHALGQRGGGDHGDHLDARLLPSVDVGGGASRAGGDDVDAERDQLLGDFGRARVHQHDVDADGLVGELARDAHLIGDPGGVRASAGDEAEAPGFADRCGEARVGDVSHAPLDDGRLDAEKLGDAGSHGALLQRVDVGDEVGDGDDALGLSELDLAALFDVAGELDHVERIDAERVERRVGGHGRAVDVEVRGEHVADDVDGLHGMILS